MRRRSTGAEGPRDTGEGEGLLGSEGAQGPGAIELAQRHGALGHHQPHVPTKAVKRTAELHLLSAVHWNKSERTAASVSPVRPPQCH